MKKTPRHLWNHSGGQASHHGEDGAVGDDRITAASKNISDLDKNVVHKILLFKSDFREWYVGAIWKDLDTQKELQIRIWIQAENYIFYKRFALIRITIYGRIQMHIK